MLRILMAVVLLMPEGVVNLALPTLYLIITWWVVSLGMRSIECRKVNMPEGREKRAINSGHFVLSATPSQRYFTWINILTNRA